MLKRRLQTENVIAKANSQPV